MPDEYSPAQLHHYWRVARRMAARWCDADADAQDAAQEVLLRLIRQNCRPSNDLAWLTVVTRRICHRMRLAAARRSGVEQSFAASRSPAVAPAVLRLEMRDIVSALPPRDRYILQLVAYGMRAREIAELLGCKTRDVGQLVSRARRRARLIRDES